MNANALKVVYSIKELNEIVEVDVVKEHYRKSLRSWVLFDFGLPVFLIIILWPIAHYLIGLDYAFERIFSAADLVPIGAVLMLATSREIDIEARMNRISNDLDWHRQTGLYIAIISLVVYMPLKYYSMAYKYPMENGTDLEGVMERLPYLSFAILVFAFSICFSAKRRMISCLKAS